MCQATKCWICRNQCRLCIRYVFCQSRLSRDLHKDVKDLGCWNSEMDEAAEHSKLLVRAVLLLRATVLWCRGLWCLSRGSLHIWRAGGAGLLQLWRLISSPGEGCSFPSQLAKFPMWQSEHSLPGSSGWCLVQSWPSHCISGKLSGLLGNMSTLDPPEIMHLYGRLPREPSCAQTARVSHLSDGAASASHECWEDKSDNSVKNGNVLLYKKVKCSSPGVFLDISERHMSFRNGIIES